MKEFEISVKVRQCTLEELSEESRLLVEKAKEATRSAYAPYSRFHVGAAILLADGTVIKGSNQENAAYPSGICAERTAAYYASASHPDVAMTKIAIAAWTRLGKNQDLPDTECFQRRPISPCGACRQALLEYEHRFGPVEVILYGLDRIYIFPSVASLLPFSFTEF